MSLAAILEAVDWLFAHVTDENGYWSYIVTGLQDYHDTRTTLPELDTEAEDRAYYRFIMRYEDETGDPCPVPDLPQ